MRWWFLKKTRSGGDSFYGVKGLLFDLVCIIHLGSALQLYNTSEEFMLEPNIST